MKQFIKNMTASFFLSICIPAFSFAQDIAVAIPFEASSDKLPAGYIVHVETMAEANFALLFPNASRQKWSFSVTGSFVSFCNGDRKARAAFDANGEMKYVITDCDINHIPPAFSKIIRDDYSGYLLYHATEIKAHGETAYTAILENATGYIMLKFTRDGLEEMEEVRK
jgi:hypothetical protein